MTVANFRNDVRETDRAAVRDLLVATGFFHASEIHVAVELVDERLTKGDRSGYEFLWAEEAGTVVGYTCYGEIACTRGSFDLYWIAVDPTRQRTGMGRQLLLRTEDAIRARHGRRIYIETSRRPLYAPTRSFYERCGYQTAAILADFYDVGDDKVIYVKSTVETSAG